MRNELLKIWKSLRDSVSKSPLDAIDNANYPSGTNPFATLCVKDNPQTETRYALVLTDDYVTCTNADPVGVNVPTNAAVPFPIGKSITIEQGGVGEVTVIGADGVTINCYNNGNATQGQYACIQLVKKAVNTWTLIGAIQSQPQ